MEYEPIEVPLSIQEAKTIISIFLMAGMVHSKSPFLHEDELDLMESVVIKLKKEFFPDEYDLIVH